METIERIRNGAVRYKNADDCYVVANPGSIWFESTLALATEYYFGEWLSLATNCKID